MCFLLEVSSPLKHLKSLQRGLLSSHPTAAHTESTVVCIFQTTPPSAQKRVQSDYISLQNPHSMYLYVLLRLYSSFLLDPVLLTPKVLGHHQVVLGVFHTCKDWQIPDWPICGLFEPNPMEHKYGFINSTDNAASYCVTGCFEFYLTLQISLSNLLRNCWEHFMGVSS